jgi:hypothetical protein
MTSSPRFPHFPLQFIGRIARSVSVLVASREQGRDGTCAAMHEKQPRRRDPILK